MSPVGCLDMKRILGVIRLSDFKDESTSPQRQREIITNEAGKRGGRIVAWAEDLDVSASKVSPFNRPELGKWLGPEGENEWDEMIFWRLDRVTRSVIDFANLIDWCDKRGKNLASATEPIDLASDYGRMLAYLVAMFAQMEAKAIRERVTASHAYLRREKRWGGGMVPFGYVPEAIETGGWRLVQSPEAVRTIRELVDRIVAGESMNSVCKDFNARGILTPRDWWEVFKGRNAGRDGVLRQWSTPTAKMILAGRGILGEAVYNKDVVRDADGMPLKRAEPIISREEWDQLQAALSDRAQDKTRTYGASLLLNVAHCWECGSPLYAQRYPAKGKVYSYYVCKARQPNNPKPCSAKSIKMEWLDAEAAETILGLVGDEEVTKTIKLPGLDHTAEIAEIDAALDELSEDRADGLYKGEAGKQRFHKIYAKLEARRETLAAEPVEGPRVRKEGTGRTFKQAWDADPEGRHRLLLDSGIKVRARRGEIFVILPEDVKARLMESARKG